MTLSEALEGRQLEIQTVHGPEKITLKKSFKNKEFVLPGKGVHSDETQGDHVVCVTVQIPRGINP